MANIDPTDLAQPENKLSSIATAQRAILFPKNDYKTTNQYSSVNPDALADGDTKGKGTGGDLDVYNQGAGAIQDILERKSEIVVNTFKPNAPYTTPSA
jgi:hypothetical protein